ncbi:MAG: NRDE family protein [Smithellaceae bacterium]
MCLILFAYKIHPTYPLIVAANRDEFYDRRSSPVEFWEDAPQILAGRDLKAGGTWLGITREGKFAAITNYRDPVAFKTRAPSRGKLIKNFLRGSSSAADYVNKISKQAGLYNGFNLICADKADLFVYSNRADMQKLTAGIYSLSNRFLDTPWPKMVRGKKALAAAMTERGPALEAALFTILANRKIAPDNKLPSTGVGVEWERLLSSIFIESPSYGTRSSTVLLIGKNRWVKFVEKVFDGKPEPWIESRISFQLDRGK